MLSMLRRLLFLLQHRLTAIVMCVALPHRTPQVRIQMSKLRGGGGWWGFGEGGGSRVLYVLDHLQTRSYMSTIPPLDTELLACIGGATDTTTTALCSLTIPRQLNYVILPPIRGYSARVRKY